MVVTNIIIIYETATKWSRLHFMHKLPFSFLFLFFWGGVVFTIGEDFHQKERANTEFWRKKCYLMSAIRWGFVLSSSLANPPRDRRHQIAFFWPNSAFSNIVWAWQSRQKKKLYEMGGLSMKQSQLSIKLREEVEKKYGTLRCGHLSSSS